MCISRHLVALSGIVTLLSGCASFAPPVPEGYTGPVAIIKDSVKSASQSKADFFYISEIDGKRIEDSRVRTLNVNRGRGFNMAPEVIERNVPAQKATFTLVGRTEYAAPILALTNSFDRPVHLLGGRPDTQRALAKHLKVFSLDCNRFTLDAQFGDYFDGDTFRPHPFGGYERCLRDSLVNINELWHDYELHTEVRELMKEAI